METLYVIPPKGHCFDKAMPEALAIAWSEGRLTNSEVVSIMRHFGAKVYHLGSLEIQP